MKKWEVCYRCNDGGFGIVGYVPLFRTKKEAEIFGEQFRAENRYVKEIIIRHPSKMYSAY